MEKLVLHFLLPVATTMSMFGARPAAANMALLSFCDPNSVCKSQNISTGHCTPVVAGYPTNITQVILKGQVGACTLYDEVNDSCAKFCTARPPPKCCVDGWCGGSWWFARGTTDIKFPTAGHIFCGSQTSASASTSTSTRTPAPIFVPRSTGDVLDELLKIHAPAPPRFEESTSSGLWLGTVAPVTTICLLGFALLTVIWSVWTLKRNTRSGSVKEEQEQQPCSNILPHCLPWEARGLKNSGGFIHHAPTDAGRPQMPPRLPLPRLPELYVDNEYAEPDFSSNTEGSPPLRSGGSRSRSPALGVVNRPYDPSPRPPTTALVRDEEQEVNENRGTSSPQLELMGHTLSINPKYNIPREMVGMGKVIGEGAFGTVNLGHVDGKLVAIKSIRDQDSECVTALVTELNIMILLQEQAGDQHPNIVRMIGAVVDQNQVDGGFLIVSEFCQHGDMQSFLKYSECDAKCNPHGYVHHADPELLPKTHKVIPKDLVRWCWEVALGMEFLESKNVGHGDLTTRNVLLTDSLQAKISDFGLSRVVYNLGTYQRKTEVGLPWRYLAPESMTAPFEVSTKSDCWSFGVLMFEVFSLARWVPHADVLDSDYLAVLLRLRNGYALPEPPHASEFEYLLMKKCWSMEKHDRPTFSWLAEKLGKQLQIQTS